MTTQFLHHQSGQLAYDDRGSGRLVICVPSMGDLRGEYRYLAPALLAAGYRVVTLDIRGHGESSTRWDDFSVAAIGSDIVALLQALDGGPAVIVGTSMAAGAAVWAAAEAPASVAGLVMIGPFVEGEANWQNRLLYGALFSRPWGAAMWARFYATLYPSRKPQDFAGYQAALRANLGQPGRLEAFQHMMLASKAASQQRLGQVKQPVLVLMGTKDPDFKNPPAEAQRVAGYFNAPYHLIEGAGHYPHAEMPAVVWPLMQPFLAEVLHAA